MCTDLHNTYKVEFPGEVQDGAMDLNEIPREEDAALDLNEIPREEDAALDLNEILREELQVFTIKLKKNCQMSKGLVLFLHCK